MIKKYLLMIAFVGSMAGAITEDALYEEGKKIVYDYLYRKNHNEATVNRLKEICLALQSEKGKVDELLHYSRLLGWQVVHYAAAWNDICMLQFLKEQGFDFNTETDSGHTPLMIAKSFGRQNAVVFLEKI